MFFLVVMLQVILLLLWLLFVFSFYVTITIDLNCFKIYLFGIKVFSKKGKKFQEFIASLIPKDETEIKFDLDLSSLYQYIHLDLIDLEIHKNVEDYANYVKVIGFINVVLSLTKQQFKNYIRHYRYLIVPSQENSLKLKIKSHFNVGTLLINYLIIRSQYAKKTYQ